MLILLILVFCHCLRVVAGTMVTADGVTAAGPAFSPRTILLIILIAWMLGLFH